MEVFREKEVGQLLVRAQIEMMLCSPSLRLQLTVIKCLIVAPWEFISNVSSSVMIIWVWVGRACNHLGWLSDGTLGGRASSAFRVFTLLRLFLIVELIKKKQTKKNLCFQLRLKFLKASCF